MPERYHGGLRGTMSSCSLMEKGKRNGTFRPPLSWFLLKTSMHCPRTIKDLLIFPASLSLSPVESRPKHPNQDQDSALNEGGGWRISPVVWVFLVLSEPARSTMENLEVVALERSSGSDPFGILMILTVKMP